MNRTVTKVLEAPLKIYSNLKFIEGGTIKLKQGTTVTLEDTGKVHEDENGISRSVFRIRRNTRNYYILD
jgi:hypothetical protein